MNFRAIESKDLSEVIDVRASTRENSFSREALRKLGITEQSTARLLETTHRGWLCEDEQKIIGFAIGDGKLGELWVIAVLPDYEGRGVGSRLIDLVEEWLWSVGWQEIWLWTSADPRKRAYRFYVERGWNISELKGDIVNMTKVRSIPTLSGLAQIPLVNR